MTGVLSVIAVAIMLVSLAYPFIRKAPASLTIAVGLFAVFMIQLVDRISLLDLAFSPIYLLHMDRLFTIFTSMFLHASFSHIIFNVIALVFLGMFLEEQIRTSKFMTIYLVSGIAGNLAYGLANFGVPSLAVGASGAISGILGAIGILYPRQGFVILFLPIKSIPAWLIVLGFLTIQFYLALVPGSNIAWEAHVGGLATGLLMAPWIVGLERARRTPTSGGVDIASFASTPEELEIVEKIRSEGIPEVRTAWLEQLARTAKCPLCGARIRLQRGDLKCRNGHRFRMWR